MSPLDVPLQLVDQRRDVGPAQAEVVHIPHHQVRFRLILLASPSELQVHAEYTANYKLLADNTSGPIH